MSRNPKSDSHAESGGASILVLSVLIGCITFLVTNFIPGGLAGGSGFFVGLLAGFFVLGALSLLAGSRSRQLRPADRQETTCPECGKSLAIAFEILKNSTDAHDDEG